MEILGVVIGAIFSLVGVYVGTTLTNKSLEKQNKDNIHASLISENRMKWIHEVRHLIIDFTSSATRLMVLNIHSENGISTEYTKELSEFKRLYSLASLYFNNNDEENKIIHRLMNELYMHTIKFDMRTYKTGVKDNETDLDIGIQKYTREHNKKELLILEEINKYLNRQWRRSKNLEVGRLEYENDSEKIETRDNQNNIDIIDVSKHNL